MINRPFRRILATTFALVFSASLIVSTAGAQTRLFGVGGLVLDDGSQHTITIYAPSITSPGYTLKMPGSNAVGALVNDGNGNLSWSASGGGVTTWSGGTTGMLPSAASSGAVTMSGTLNVANGGTGQSSALTQYGVVYGASSSAMGTTGAGATGQVLIGNSGGAPSWSNLSSIGVTSFSAGTTGLLPSSATTGAVTLTGTLAIANGGTGQTTANAAFNALAPSQATNAGDVLTTNGTNTAWTSLGGVAVTSFSAGTTGLLPSSATTGAVTLTGTLGIANGGTGQTTANAAFNALAPSQATNAGDVLTTNGTNTAWTSLGGVAVTSFSAGTTGLLPSSATTGAVTLSGTLAIANGGTGQTTANAAFNALAPSQATNAGDVLTTNGTNTAWTSLGGVAVTSFSAGTTGLLPSSATTGAVTLSGTLAIANGGTGQTTANAAFNALAPSQATNAGDVLTTNGTNTAWTSLGGVAVTSFSAGTTGLLPSSATTGAVTLSGTLAIANGGTGQTTANAAFNALAPSQATNAGDVLTTNGTNTAWTSLGGVAVTSFSAGTTGLLPSSATTGAVTLTGTLGIANGGTGQTTANAAFNALAPSQATNAGDVLTTNGTNTAWTSLGGVAVTSFSAGTTGLLPSSATTGAVTLTGTLGIANGGTGQTTANAAFNALAPSQSGNSGYILTTNGTNTSWEPAPATGVTTFSAGTTGLLPSSATNGAVTLSGTLAIANGGTGQTSANAAFNALAPSQSGNSGYILTTNGTNTSWEPAPATGVTTFSAGTTGLLPSSATNGAVTLSGTLAIANGGTGQTSANAAFNALAPSQGGNSGDILTTDGTNTSWTTLSGLGVLYNIAPTSAQATATTGNDLFNVQYASGGVASALGAFITSTATATGNATGLTVSAGGSTTAGSDNAIVATFLGTATSTGVSINTSPAAGAAGSTGLSIGLTNAPDVGAKIDGGITSDVQLGGGYATAGAYSLQFVGQGSDPTDAAIGVTGTYSNGFLANSTVSGMYGKTSATTVVSVGSTSHFGAFTGSFGVRGEATGNGAGARIIGVWGLASNNNTNNTGSIGVRAQGDSVKTVGHTDMALDITNGELTMGRTTDPGGKDDVNTSPINPATNGLQGPSGMVALTTSFTTSQAAPNTQEQDFTVGNEYCSTTSMVLATVQNDPDHGNCTYAVQVVPASGSFTLKLTQSVLTGQTSAATSPTVNVGYIIVNASR